MVELNMGSTPELYLRPYKTAERHAAMSELIRERVIPQPRISMTQNFETDENVEKIVWDTRLILWWPRGVNNYFRVKMLCSLKNCAFAWFTANSGSRQSNFYYLL